MERTRDRKNISELRSYISYLLCKMIRKTDFAQTGRIDQTDRKKYDSNNCYKSPGLNKETGQRFGTDL